MKVVITSATAYECQMIKNRIDELYTTQSGRFRLSFHKSGVGLLPSSFSIQKMIQEQRPDLVIQAGISGTFTTDVSITQVVAVRNECLGDVGVEENGTFTDVFDMQLENENEFPFIHKRLENPWLGQYNLLQLKEVPAVTINEISTRPDRIGTLQHKYGAAIESMEGAALHYVGLATNTPFIQMRAISNFVGERDKTNWRMQEALDNLTTIILQYIDKLYHIR